MVFYFFINNNNIYLLDKKNINGIYKKNKRGI